MNNAFHFSLRDDPQESLFPPRSHQIEATLSIDPKRLMQVFQKHPHLAREVATALRDDSL
jgi:hypothetical protein